MHVRDISIEFTDLVSKTLEKKLNSHLISSEATRASIRRVPNFGALYEEYNSQDFLEILDEYMGEEPGWGIP